TAYSLAFILTRPEANRHSPSDSRLGPEAREQLDIEYADRFVIFENNEPNDKRRLNRLADNSSRPTGPIMGIAPFQRTLLQSIDHGEKRFEKEVGETSLLRGPRQRF